MVNMRESQFSEIVMRCLSSTSSYLEKKETLHYLQEDVSVLEAGLLDFDFNPNDSDAYAETLITIEQTPEVGFDNEPIKNHSPLYNPTIDDLKSKYKSMQEVIRTQYLYQRGLLNEVILSILRESGNRPVFERADSTLIREHLKKELLANGLNLPFAFSVNNSSDQIIYSTASYDPELMKGVYSQPLFENTDSKLILNVEFPTKKNYIFSSVRFIIPSLAFTLILLVVFVFTILMAFRQKKLSEVKTDFINNMTHELKTPISTISLAAQMLNDDSVRKSESSLKHMAKVIAEESKRLQFQVDKVLQMSILDKSLASLKFSIVDANMIIDNVVNTFKIKAEKYGGHITCNLDAADAEVNVDQMHFTNIIYNLLDNAIKYRKEDSEPELDITTKDIGNKLEIRVKDNGIGLKKEDLKKIFDKFYRVSTGNRHDVKGFGLGLAYVKKMVTMFNGTIFVESDLGKGSTFIIRLPLVSSE